MLGSRKGLILDFEVSEGKDHLVKQLSEEDLTSQIAARRPARLSTEWP